MFVFAIILSELFDLIKMITCFLKKYFVVMLSLSLFFWFELLMTLYTLEILLVENFGNMSLMLEYKRVCLTRDFLLKSGFLEKF